MNNMMEHRLNLAHYYKYLPFIFAFDAQCEVFCHMAETISDAFNDDEKKALQIRKLLVAHGRGLAQSGDLLISNPDCDNEHRHFQELSCADRCDDSCCYSC